jgi:hypothetical protein
VRVVKAADALRPGGWLATITTHHIAGPVPPRAVPSLRMGAPYTTASYLDLLRAYSGHRDLDPEPRSGLLGCIADLIDSRYGGQIAKRYLTELRIARGVQPPPP